MLGGIDVTRTRQIHASFHKVAQQLDEVIKPMLRAARVPGAALAIVHNDTLVFANGYGYHDLENNVPMSARAAYPIASTTKAITATVLAMLADDGWFSWDEPVQRFLPSFQLRDPIRSMYVTIRDLLVMRTGLPRHDWMWIEHGIDRAELVRRLRYLECSSGFRERFQYNNLTFTAAAYIAELAVGRSWEDLVTEKIFAPLGMTSTSFKLPTSGEATRSYQENSERDLVPTRRFCTESIAPAGGTIHSTVEDMARWLALNLNGGKLRERALLRPQVIAECHRPQVVTGDDPSALHPNGTYAAGWFVDTYNGSARLSHGGLLHGVNSSVMMFPEWGLGIVSFVNFAASRMARVINQYVFDLVLGNAPEQHVNAYLVEYEAKVASTRRRNSSVPRVEGTTPAHGLDAYAGTYVHPAYGEIAILCSDMGLELRRNSMSLVLEHWHFESWIAVQSDLFEIQAPHPFDRAGRIKFESNVDGRVCALGIRLEPSVLPVRFVKIDSEMK